MKELRITAIVPMPDDAMEAGEKMAAFKPQIKALEEALGVRVEAKLVRPTERKAVEKPPVVDAIDRSASYLHAAKVA